MKIGRYPFKAAQVQVGDRIRGHIEVPQGSRVVHYGVAPDLKGNLCAWVEEGSLAVSPTGAPPTESLEFYILKHGDEIPAGYEYSGYILANPMLLVYMRVAKDSAGRLKLN